MTVCGWEASKRPQDSRLDSSVKLIVSSGYSDAPVYRGKYGFDDSIPKPWTVARVSEVVEGSRIGLQSRAVRIDQSPQVYELFADEPPLLQHPRSLAVWCGYC